MPKPQCDSIWRWRLWEVIRHRLGHEGGDPRWDGTSDLIRIGINHSWFILCPVKT